MKKIREEENNNAKRKDAPVQPQIIKLRKKKSRTKDHQSGKLHQEYVTTIFNTEKIAQQVTFQKFEDLGVLFKESLNVCKMIINNSGLAYQAF